MKNKVPTSELRIGNYLWYAGSEYLATVDLIHGKNHFDCRDEFGGFTPNGDYNAIPLTEEWLLKFGFKRQTKITYIKLYSIQCKKSKIWFSVNETGDTNDPNELSLKEEKVWWSFGDNKHDIKVEYVHQLQNLYFALTQEELTPTAINKLK